MVKDALLYIPENWPCAWWSADQSLVRMSCPACGNFSLFLDRSNGKPKIDCRTCHLSGIATVQDAFTAYETNRRRTSREEAAIQAKLAESADHHSGKGKRS